MLILLVTNLRFSKKHVEFKNHETPLEHPKTFSYIFIIKKDESFCDQNFKSVGISKKEVENFHIYFAWLKLFTFSKQFSFQCSTRLCLSQDTIFIKFLEGSV